MILRMLLTLLLGAIGGALRRRTLAGLIPGAALGWATCAAARGTLAAPSGPLGPCRISGIILIGFASLLLTGAAPRGALDVPLDSRLVGAFFIGFTVRGAASVFTRLTG